MVNSSSYKFSQVEFPIENATHSCVESATQQKKKWRDDSSRSGVSDKLKPSDTVFVAKPW
jgi:hypothetical protein